MYGIDDEEDSTWIQVLQKCGLYAKLIECVRNGDVTVRFEDGKVKDNIKLKKFLNGELVSICDRELIEKFVIEKRVTIGNIHWLRLVKNSRNVRRGFK